MNAKVVKICINEELLQIKAWKKILFSLSTKNALINHLFYLLGLV